MRRKVAFLTAVAVMVIILVLFFPQLPLTFHQTDCPRKGYLNLESYLSRLKARGLDCRVIETIEHVEGVPEGCDPSGLARTYLLVCEVAGGTDARTAYGTSGGGVAEFLDEEGETKAIHIPVSEHCHHLVFDEPFWYAEKQEMAGFDCTQLNESETIYDMTLVCKEFMYKEAQRDAGTDLVKTIYFTCVFDDGKTNTFPVYETADGRYVFFGELK